MNQPERGLLQECRKAMLTDAIKPEYWPEIARLLDRIDAALGEPAKEPASVRVCPIKDIQCSTPSECGSVKGGCKLLDEPHDHYKSALEQIYRTKPHEGGAWEIAKAALTSCPCK